MSVFADLNEIRLLGAPIVGLFRVALGRDPDPLEIQRFAPDVRDRTPLATIAASIIETPEYARCTAGLTSHDKVDFLLGNAFGPARSGLEGIGGIADWAGTDAELIAVITEVALIKGTVPLLPGLVPGVPPDDPVAYRLWASEYDRSAAPGEAADDRLVCLLMKAGDTEAEAAERSVAALTRQTHRNWELRLAARTLSPWPRQTIEALARDEPRVRLVDGAGLAAALAAAAGPLAGVMAPGDVLAPDALSRVVAAFEPLTELVFTDDDVEDASGRHSPRFLPGFSPDRPLPSGGLAVARRDLFDPATAHITAQLDPARVRHVPTVALHRAAVARDDDPDIFSGARFAVPDPPPPVTIVVLTKDHPDLLAGCTHGVLDRTDYPALDLILVDNGTTDEAALALLAELEERSNVRVLRRPGPFNFAALNNEAVRTVAGGMLLLLNNDTEILDPGWLAEMVAQLARPGVGIVGARLLYPDRTVQHAGILLGPGGRATHVGRGAAETATGYLGQLAGVRDFSAVTGACLAIAVETWNRIGGMDERFAVTWNDVDLCLRVRRAGLRVVWTPRATLIHKESVTRGLEAEDAAKLARFREEQALMLAEWGDALDRDPFLNPNLLALDSGQLVLTRPRQLASARLASGA